MYLLCAAGCRLVGGCGRLLGPLRALDCGRLCCLGASQRHPQVGRFRPQCVSCGLVGSLQAVQIVYMIFGDEGRCVSEFTVVTMNNTVHAITLVRYRAAGRQAQ